MSMWLRVLSFVVVWALAGMAMGPAAQATVTCTSVSMTDVNIGTLQGQSGQTAQTTGTLSFSCSGLSVSTTAYVCLTLGSGTGGGGTGGANRTMLSGANTLAYQLYYGGYAGAGTAFSANTAVAFLVTTDSSGNASGQPVTIYGNVPSLPSIVAAGSYSSTFSGASASLGAGSTSACGNYTTTLSFNAQATVNAACTTTSGTMAFGSVDLSTSSAINTSTNLTITCTSGWGYSVSLGKGNGNNGSGGCVTDYAHRLMSTSGYAHSITYGLYKDSGLSNVWGDVAGINNLIGQTASGSAQNIPVYGHINSGQSGAATGNYSDVVLVTTTY